MVLASEPCTRDLHGPFLYCTAYFIVHGFDSSTQPVLDI